jgi:hypothetical protein
VRHRPSYDEVTLARAIRGGIDAAGKPLDPVMPRYSLNDVEMKVLTGYLFTLSAHSSPGVDEQDIHFATVIQPNVAPEKRRAMVAVMQAFFKDKGANVRSDEQRREAGNMRMYRAYRKWVLHVWELSGASETWGAQLETYYSAQPVFALIAGMGTASWQPIHDFSERFEVPCVLPQVNLPFIGEGNNYTFYFSRGVTLEAEALAKFLHGNGNARKIIQVFRREEQGATGAAAFRTALAGAIVEDQVLEGPATEAFWRAIGAAKPDIVVAWLGAQDMAGSHVLGEAATPVVYLSSSIWGGRHTDATPWEGLSVRLIYPYDPSPRREARLLRTKQWLLSKAIPLTDEAVQVNTQFTLAIVNDVLGHMQDSFSRDYFIERIEHAVNQTPIPSMYPHISLGPGQRFAAKGSYIVEIGRPNDGELNAVSDWIVP